MQITSLFRKLRSLVPEKPLLLAALFAIAYLGNVFKLNLFFGIDFLFGSISVWLILSLYGPFWGITAGAFAAFHTFILWDHPYAIVIFTCEVLFVSYFKTRHNERIAFFDVFYWLGIGIPLVLIFYGVVLQVSWQGAIVIALKQSVNGIFNAEITSLILAYLPLKKIFSLGNKDEQSSLKQVLFTILIAFVVFPILTLTILNAHEKFSAIEESVDQTLIQSSQTLREEIILWEGQYLHTFRYLANLIAKEGLDSSRSQNVINAIESLYPEPQYRTKT